ncbi:MAG TPA: protein kinase [Solirubrobacteraceae bacterium]|nr:protein kinase [Solirubrobacteraceae bacterium]
MPLIRRQFSLAVGDIVDGRFRLLAELGEGGMSRVYEAEDLKYDRPAAVKVLAHWLAEDDEFRERFSREAAAAERANHPHVLPVWAHGEQDGLLFLVTPLCDCDLGGVLRQRGQLDAGTALAIIAQVAWALDWAHGRGIVHRDVKPENVLLITGPGTDHAYLADFGLAKVASAQTLTQSGHPAGLTPAYAAPEQWLDEAVGPAADQYALAATLYTCLAGHPPFHPRRGPSLREAHLRDMPPELTGVVPGLPAGIAEAVSRALAKDPRRRFGTCGEFVTAAQSAMQRANPPATPGPAGSTDGRSASSAADQSAAWAPTAPDIPGPEATGPADEPAPASAPVVLTPEPAPPPHFPAPTRHGRRRLVLAGTLAIALATVVAVALVLLSGGADRPTSRAPDTPASRLSQIRVGAGPIALASGTGGVWVANSVDGTVSRIAPRKGAVRGGPSPAVDRPFSIAVDDGAVWVVGLDGGLAHIDPRSGRRVARANLGISADGVAAGAGALWVINTTAGTVTRVSTRSSRPHVGRPLHVGDGTSDIAVAFGSVWITNSGSGTLVRLDPSSGRVLSTTPLRGAADAVAVGEGAVWALSPGRGRVLRVDPASGATEVIAVPRAEGGDIAVGDGAVFYVSHDDGTAVRIDAATRRRAGAPVRVAADARGAAIADGALFVANFRRGTVAKLTF